MEERLKMKPKGGATPEGVHGLERCLLPRVKAYSKVG